LTSLTRLATITVTRRAESRKEATGRKSNNNGVAASCPTCDRKLRMSRSAWDQGAVVCWPCLEAVLVAQGAAGARLARNLGATLAGLDPAAAVTFTTEDLDEEEGE
jgi:hypothetical protein